jgi:pimeloyl-ACP methyl ester carboxylesterase
VYDGPMPRAACNGIELEYDTFGSPDGRPLLLIQGLSAQMLLWYEEFCELLADRGHYVIRFDNRDIGLSSKFDVAGTPNIPLLFAKSQLGFKVTTPYTLTDMALDAVGLLDALGLRSAHICGSSLGARVAHLIAIGHRARIRLLTSMMSSTGNPKLPPPHGKVTALLARAPRRHPRAQRLGGPQRGRCSMKPSTMVHDPAATDASPRLGWRVALNRFIWRAHIFTASSLVVWLERWFPNRGYGERLLPRPPG